MGTKVKERIIKLEESECEREREKEKARTTGERKSKKRRVVERVEA